MNTGALDPLLHHPGRLRIVATLAALPDGDALSVPRLRDVIGLPASGPIAGLRELDRAGYVRTGKARGELSRAARDLPDITALSAPLSFLRGKRAISGRQLGRAPGPRAWPHRRGRTRGRSSLPRRASVMLAGVSAEFA